MSLPITKNTQLALNKTKKEPSLVVKFDGIGTLFAAQGTLQFVRIGDEGLLIGGGWYIGGMATVGDQIEALTFKSDSGSTSSSINYKLNPDMGFGSSVSSFNVTMIDTESRELLSIFSEQQMLGRKVQVWYSPDYLSTSYPEDYILKFRGLVDEINFGVGTVGMTFSHPDQKKRQSIFTKFTTQLDGPIDDIQSTIDVLDTSGFLTEITGPDGNIDPAVSFFVRIDDEIIQYTGLTATTLTGCTRGKFSSIADSHDDEAEVGSFYRIEDNCVDVALKTMLSGWNDSFVTGVPVDSFNVIPPNVATSSAIYLDGINVELEYGLTPGDFVGASGSASGNDFSLAPIESVNITDAGSYVTVSGVTFTTETASPAVVEFRSKYDVYPDGLKMSPDEVDVLQHERLRDTFLSGVPLDFYLKDTIENGKEFLEQKVYAAVSAYSVPRKTRSSMAYHIGPIPNEAIPTLGSDEVLNAAALIQRRGLGKNFYNTIIYKYDEDAVDERFLKGLVTVDAASKAAIPVGNRALVIEANGVRQGGALLSDLSQRRLDRYSFGAKSIQNIKLNLETGMTIEMTDLVILDGISLKIPDPTLGTPTTEAKIQEVQGLDFNFRTGVTTIELLETTFDLTQRYALISPASLVQMGTDGSHFNIKPSFTEPFGSAEYRKWERYLPDLVIRVRTEDYTIAATGIVDEFLNNAVVLVNDLGFTPSAGMIMELADYNDATETIKLIYGFISATSGEYFDDGKPSYVMI